LKTLDAVAGTWANRAKSAEPARVRALLAHEEKVNV